MFKMFCQLNELDILFTPLVAFDKRKLALMGGGFYDRTLQNWQNKSFYSSWFSAPMSASRKSSHWALGCATV